jgi:hypothetical protein
MPWKNAMRFCSSIPPQIMTKQYAANILTVKSQKTIHPEDIQDVSLYTGEENSVEDSYTFVEKLVIPAIHAYMVGAGFENELEYHLEHHNWNNHACILVSDYTVGDEPCHHTEYIQDTFDSYMHGERNLTDAVTDCVLQVIDDFTGAKHCRSDVGIYVDIAVQAYRNELQKNAGALEPSEDTSPYRMNAEEFGMAVLQTINAYMRKNSHLSGVGCHAVLKILDGQPYVILEDKNRAQKEERIQALFADYLSGEKNFGESVADAALFALSDFYGEEFPSRIIRECTDAVMNAWEDFGIAETEQEEDENLER